MYFSKQRWTLQRRERHLRLNMLCGQCISSIFPSPDDRSLKPLFGFCYIPFRGSEISQNTFLRQKALFDFRQSGSFFVLLRRRHRQLCDRLHMFQYSIILGLLVCSQFHALRFRRWWIWVAKRQFPGARWRNYCVEFRHRCGLYGIRGAGKVIRCRWRQFFIDFKGIQMICCLNRHRARKLLLFVRDYRGAVVVLPSRRSPSVPISFPEWHSSNPHIDSSIRSRYRTTANPIIAS